MTFTTQVALINLGTVARNLKEVVISGRKPMIEIIADRTIIVEATVNG